MTRDRSEIPLRAEGLRIPLEGGGATLRGQDRQTARSKPRVVASAILFLCAAITCLINHTARNDDDHDLHKTGCDPPFAFPRCAP